MTLDDLCYLFPELIVNITPTNNPKELLYKLRQEYALYPEKMGETIEGLIEFYNQKLLELTPYEIKRKALQEMTQFALLADNIDNPEVSMFLNKSTQDEINKCALLLLVQGQYYGTMTNSISLYCDNLRGLQLAMYIFTDIEKQEQPKSLH